MELVRYDAMCRAIDQAFEVDEVKDIRDKAMALEAYSRQARNTENERRACEIRLRAERKAGELLSKTEKAKAGRPPENRSHDDTNYRGAPTLEALGISKTQSSKWQQLAAVPQEQFEAALAGPQKPTTNGILTTTREQSAMDPKALWLWGRLRDFERDGLLDADPKNILDEMTDAMRADTLRLAPIVRDWLGDLVE